jgi:predicted DNA-binding transcriptional regulator AlpA
MSQATTQTKKPRKKITYLPAPLPLEGFCRKPSFMAVLGISSNAFDNGIKKGILPKGKLLSPRCRVWSVHEIRAFLASLENGGSQP